jgi:hypothetical protein
MKYFTTTVMLIVYILLSGCGESTPPPPDISDIKADYQTIRTEYDLYRTSKVLSGNDINNLIQKYPGFYEIYFSHVLPVYDGKNNDSLALAINEMLKETQINKLLDTVNLVFGEMGGFNADFDRYFRYLKYYFPDYPTPDLYTFISEFAYQVFVFEASQGKDGIGIGLDMFLGPDFNYKMIAPDNPAFSDYLTRTWNRDHIVRKVSDLIVYDLIGDPPGIRLIDQMIWHGKALFLTDLLMPFAHDSIVTEFSEIQLDWCYNNELEMWAFFLDQNLMYETNPSKINKYISPAPSSPGMPGNAPGRSANYLGWQIIKAYMKRNPDTTLDQLIQFKDSQALLDQSRYKPKRK